MLTLVEDILRLSQLDEGSLELKPQEVDLKQLAQETITSLQPKAEQREVTLSVTGDAPTVTTDPALLGEILYNLLDNAIKYNRAGGKARASAFPRSTSRRCSSASTGWTRAAPRPQAARGWACPSSSTRCSCWAGNSAWKATPARARP